MRRKYRIFKSDDYLIFLTSIPQDCRSQRCKICSSSIRLIAKNKFDRLKFQRQQNGDVVLVVVGVGGNSTNN